MFSTGNLFFHEKRAFATSFSYLLGFGFSGAGYVIETIYTCFTGLGVIITGFESLIGFRFVSTGSAGLTSFVLLFTGSTGLTRSS